MRRTIDPQLTGRPIQVDTQQAHVVLKGSVPDRALHGTLEGVHEVMSNLMLGAVALHVAATLWHAFIRRDGVMRHMLPGGAR